MVRVAPADLPGLLAFEVGAFVVRGQGVTSEMN